MPANEGIRLKKRINQLFLQLGLRQGDGAKFMKLCISLALNTFTSLEFYLDLPILDLIEIAEEVKDVTPNG